MTPARISYGVLIGALVLVGWLHLATLLLATFFSFFALRKLLFGGRKWLAVVLFILLWRILIEWLNRAYGGGEKVLLIGSGNLGIKLTEVLRNRTDLPSLVRATGGAPGGTGRVFLLYWGRAGARERLTWPTRWWNSATRCTSTSPG